VTATVQGIMARKHAAWFLLGALLCCLWQIAAVFRVSARETNSISQMQLTWQQLGIYCWWTTVSSMGSRRFISLVKAIFPQFADTLFYYPALAHPGIAGMVALTIDDGICRQGQEQSMLSEVLALLKNHSAHATFFLNSKSLHEGDLARLVRDGHELANHLPQDQSYASFEAPDFRRVFLETDAALAPYLPSGSRRWFRAPQGRLTGAMVDVLRELNVTHVLGDSYADDWAITDPQLVASLYLSMVKPGSVLIMHMPERGFREHTHETIRLVLEGLRLRGLTAVTLGKLSAHAFAVPLPPSPGLLRGGGSLPRRSVGMADRDDHQVPTR